MTRRELTKALQRDAEQSWAALDGLREAVLDLAGEAGWWDAGSKARTDAIRRRCEDSNPHVRRVALAMLDLTPAELRDLIVELVGVGRPAKWGQDDFRRIGDLVGSGQERSVAAAARRVVRERPAPPGGPLDDGQVKSQAGALTRAYRDWRKTRGNIEAKDG